MEILNQYALSLEQDEASLHGYWLYSCSSEGRLEQRSGFGNHEYTNNKVWGMDVVVKLSQMKKLGLISVK